MSVCAVREEVILEGCTDFDPHSLTKHWSDLTDILTRRYNVQLKDQNLLKYLGSV